MDNAEIETEACGGITVETGEGEVAVAVCRVSGVEGIETDEGKEAGMRAEEEAEGGEAAQEVAVETAESTEDRVIHECSSVGWN